MSYTVKQVSKLSGVSVRTLHYYDEIGLLKPGFVKDNGYRYYGEKELLRLQQILFFRELEIPLETIQEILTDDRFDRIQALHQHKRLLGMKMERLNTLMGTIDRTIEHLRGEAMMSNDEIYEGFDKAQQEQYEAEIRNGCYGDCGVELLEESKRRLKNWRKADYEETKTEMDALHQAFAEALEKGLAIDTSEVQALTRKHFQWINRFYAPPKEVYRGLGHLYCEDPRFRKNYDPYHPQLAEYMRDAMGYFADREMK